MDRQGYLWRPRLPTDRFGHRDMLFAMTIRSSARSLRLFFCTLALWATQAPAQAPVDHVRLLGHYVQAEIAMVRCRPTDATGRTAFVEHMRTVEQRATSQLRLRYPDLPADKVDEMLGEGRRAMDKAVRETVAKEGCSAPLIEDLLRRYRDFATRAP